MHHFDAGDGRALRTYQAADGIPDGPTAIAIAPSGVWVGSDLETAVARIDPETNTIDRLGLGGITGWIAVDGQGDVWVTVRAAAGVGGIGESHAGASGPEDRGASRRERVHLRGRAERRRHTLA